MGGYAGPTLTVILNGLSDSALLKCRDCWRNARNASMGPAPKKRTFNPKAFLTKLGAKTIRADYGKGQLLFAQGDLADTVFYIVKGKVKLSVVSKQGKEAVIAILGAGDFFGEGCLAGQLVRMSTAAGISECTVIELKKETAVRVLHNEPAFSELFLAHLLSRNIRIEEDLVDQLFNSSEKRLARASPAGELREGRQAREGSREDQPGNPGLHRRHHTFPSELFHEPVSQAGIHRL